MRLIEDDKAPQGAGAYRLYEAYQVPEQELSDGAFEGVLQTLELDDNRPVLSAENIRPGQLVAIAAEGVSVCPTRGGNG